MKAVQVVKYGDTVEGVELREIPEPGAPKSGQALVGVEFSPMNFNDLLVVWGALTALEARVAGYYGK